MAPILFLPTLSPSSRLPGWQPGTEPPPRLWKSRFSLCPWEAARWGGEDGAFSFVELLREQGRVSQPFGTFTGEVTIQGAQVKCLSLIPARWQEQGCSSHPGCSSAKGGVGSRAAGPRAPLQGPGIPLGSPKLPSATTHPVSTHRCQQHIWDFRLNLQPPFSF